MIRLQVLYILVGRRHLTRKFFPSQPPAVPWERLEISIDSLVLLLHSCDTMSPVLANDFTCTVPANVPFKVAYRADIAVPSWCIEDHCILIERISETV